MIDLQILTVSRAVKAPLLGEVLHKKYPVRFRTGCLRVRKVRDDDGGDIAFRRLWEWISRYFELVVGIVTCANGTLWKSESALAGKGMSRMSSSGSG